MIWELIEDYKKEYQQSGWKFHTRYKGPLLLNFSLLLVVLIVVVGIARSAFELSEVDVSLLVMITCVIGYIVLWYPVRKAGLARFYTYLHRMLY